MADRKPGEAPPDSVADRAAQDHDYADVETGGAPQRGIDYPADDLPNRKGDITPDAADPHVAWDTRIQPERIPDEADPPGDIERGA
jgi:hypothetical protein